MAVEFCLVSRWMGTDFWFLLTIGSSSFHRLSELSQILLHDDLLWSCVICTYVCLIMKLEICVYVNSLLNVIIEWLNVIIDSRCRYLLQKDVTMNYKSDDVSKTTKKDPNEFILSRVTRWLGLQPSPVPFLLGWPGGLGLLGFFQFFVQSRSLYPYLILKPVHFLDF